MSLSLGLGLALTRNKGVRLFPQASAGWDFVRGTYKNAAGYVRTNYILNSTPTLGAVTGVVGSGGALPTRWVNQYNPSGLTTTVVGTGTENGSPYIDIRVSGTWGTAGSNQYNLSFGNSTDVVAANGEAWCAAVPVRVAAGSLTNVATVKIEITQNTAAGAYVSSVLSGDWRSAISAAATPLRINGYGTLAGGASVARAAPQLQLIGSVSSPVDVTLRVGPPQFEKATYPSSYILTSGSAASVTTYTSTNPADVGNMTFTRASGGYAEDASGNLVLFGSGVPRITNKGVLIEPAATNILLRSTDLSQSPWLTSANSSVTANYALAPDGTMTATRAQRSAAGGPNFLVRQYVTVTAQAYTMSVYIKSNTGQNQSGFLRYYDNVTGGALGITATPVWQRVTFPITSTGSGPNFQFDVEFKEAGADVLVWGGQLETGAIATSLIATGATTATRAADVFYYSGASVASSFTLAATIEHAFANNGSGFYPVVSIGGSYNNVASISRRDASSNYQGLIRSSAATAAEMIAGGAPTTGVHFLALRVNDNQFALAKDGAIISTDTVGTSPALNGDRLAIGTESWSPGSQGVAGYIPRIAIYPFAASDAQLQSLSLGNFI